jgi:hypothetical protein
MVELCQNEAVIALSYAYYGWVVIGAIGLFFISNFLWCCGSWGKKVALIVRSIQACMITALGIIVIGILLLAGKNYVDDFEDSCDDIFGDADSALVKAASLLCTYMCSCDISKELQQIYEKKTQTQSNFRPV